MVALLLLTLVNTRAVAVVTAAVAAGTAVVTAVVATGTLWWLVTTAVAVGTAMVTAVVAMGTTSHGRWKWLATPCSFSWVPPAGPTG